MKTGQWVADAFGKHLFTETLVSGAGAAQTTVTWVKMPADWDIASLHVVITGTATVVIYSTNEPGFADGAAPGNAINESGTLSATGKVIVLGPADGIGFAIPTWASGAVSIHLRATKK